LQLRLTITPLFTAMHAFFSSLTIFPHDLWLGYFFYSRDPRFMSLLDSPWFVKFSKMANFNFGNRDLDLFYFLRFVTRTPLPFPFKVFVYGKGDSSKYT
jgi:hypothetical protein